MSGDAAATFLLRTLHCYSRVSAVLVFTVYKCASSPRRKWQYLVRSPPPASSTGRVGWKMEGDRESACTHKAWKKPSAIPMNNNNNNVPFLMPSRVLPSHQFRHPSIRCRISPGFYYLSLSLPSCASPPLSLSKIQIPPV